MPSLPRPSHACFLLVMNAESKDIEDKAAFGEENDSPSGVSIESYLDVREKDKVQRRLHQRHIQMWVVVLSSPACSC